MLIFLENRSPYLFIFNPCIRMQLISPGANFYFFLAVSLRLFLFIHFIFFLPIFPFYVPLKMLESLWFSDVFLRTWNGSIGHIWINQWWSHLAGDVLSLYALEAPESMWFSGAFLGYGMRTLEIQEINISIKSKETSSKKIRSTEKSEELL